MSVVNSGWLHKEENPNLRGLDLPANSDHLLENDSVDTSAQGPTVFSFGLPHLHANSAPSWPGLQALLQQLPPQDSDERYCLAPGEEELAELRVFCAQRRREALGQGVVRLLPPKWDGHTCEKCREPLRPGEYGVFAARAGDQRCWHRSCFACQACGQALINLIYFYRDGRLYCGRHHAELLRPRCPACDQLIFSRHCTEAEGRRWHKDHFCCQDCARPLEGGRYALPGGSPCCPSCFEGRYSEAATALERRVPLGGVEPRQVKGALNAETSSILGSQREPLESNPRESRAGSVDQASRECAHGRMGTSSDFREDAPCPTCSSSSDSELDGFFLGQRLPQPGETLDTLQAASTDTSGKPCIIC